MSDLSKVKVNNQTYEIKDSVARKDLSELLTAGGRNLAIYKTAYITPSTTYYGNFMLKQNTADTREFLQLEIYVNSPGTDTIVQTLCMQDVTKSRFLHYTNKLNQDTSQIRVKANGIKIDAPSIRFILPKTLKAGTWVTVSLEVTNVTQGSFTFKNIKIEEGKIATTWTPAPEDIVIGGRNLISKNWRTNTSIITGFNDSVITKTIVNNVPEFNGCNANNPAVKITTSGGTHQCKMKLNVIDNLSLKKEYDVVWSIYIKNIGNAPFKVAGVNALSYEAQIIEINTAKKVVVTERILPAYYSAFLQFYTSNASDNLNFIIWNPQIQIGNVATEYQSPDEQIVTTTLDGLMSATDKIKLDSLSNYTLPIATSSVLGGIKLGSDTQQSVAANSVSSTANRTYAVQKNASNQLVVNVPWLDSNTDTKVTQSPTNINTEYNILTTAANRTSSVTDVTNFSTKLTYNPGTSTLKNDGCSQVYDSTNKCLKFVFS